MVGAGIVALVQVGLLIVRSRGELESARQVFAILIEGIWFAQDSPLEGTGFEPSVPPLERALAGSYCCSAYLTGRLDGPRSLIVVAPSCRGVVAARLKPILTFMRGYSGG